MRRGSELLLSVFLIALVLGPACKRGTDSPDLSKLGPSSAATSTVLPVGSPLCPGGGIGIYAGSDTNGNGVLEAPEVLKGTPVCGPLTDVVRPGGLVSLVMIASEPTGTVHCPAGGLKVLSGPDANRNGALEASEVAFTEYLCNGAPGAGSAAGITVAVEPPAPPVDNKKNKRPAASKKPNAASSKASAKTADKAVSQPAEAQAAPTDPAAASKKAAENGRTASSNKEKGGSAKPAAAPKGWTNVKVGNPQLAQAAYKVEGRSITVRFTNLSASMVRFKYTVRWKVNQNGSWVDDSTMEGIGFRLKPQESLDREVRTQTQDIRDVVVDLDAVETS